MFHLWNFKKKLRNLRLTYRIFWKSEETLETLVDLKNFRVYRTNFFIGQFFFGLIGFFFQIQNFWIFLKNQFF